MKIFDDLLYRAGGYSAADLIHANPTECRQIRQLGRASLISILASMTSWGTASFLLTTTDNVPTRALILLLVISLTATVMYSLNRTLFYYSDIIDARNRSVSLPLFRIVLVVLATVLCYLAISHDHPYRQVFPILLAAFELYPLLLKMLVGQTIAGHREQARIEHEHMRGDLKKQEYAQNVEHTLVKMNISTDTATRAPCPDYDNFNADVCKAKIEDDALYCIPCPHFEKVRAMH